MVLAAQSFLCRFWVDVGSSPVFRMLTDVLPAPARSIHLRLAAGMVTPTLSAVGVPGYRMLVLLASRAQSGTLRLYIQAEPP